MRPYKLYGMPASLYTGKVRSYLRKQTIPHIEAAMGSAHFRDTIVPRIGRFIVPVLETPEGDLIQDGAAIIDHFETRGEVPLSVQPQTPRHQMVSRIFELFGGEGLLRPAMHYRWNFPDENERFLRFEFGRHLAPEADANGQAAVFDFAAGRMKHAATLFGVVPESFATIEASYAEFLALFGAHCAAYPYLLGDQPSRGDYGLIAPLFAHLARDPKPADLMRRTAPAVARWVERMNASGLDHAEFLNAKEGFLPGDAIPPTLIALLRYVAEDYLGEIEAHVTALNEYLAAQPVNAGDVIGGKPSKRMLGEAALAWRGHTLKIGVFPYRAWLLQRMQDEVDGFAGADRASALALLEETGLSRLMRLRLSRRIDRANNCEVWGEQQSG